MREYLSKIIFFSFVFFLGCSLNSNAQNTDDTRTVKTDDGVYIIHTVEAKQTLYAISKMYSVSVDDIQKANPELIEFGIRIGQTLRIPSNKVDKKEAKKSDVKIKGDTIYHEVLKKETIYALTKKYEISEEELFSINPDLKDGLKIGMIVKIPSVPESDKSSQAQEFSKPISDSLVLHEVQPKETLYSLSKKYGVTPDSIQMVNDGLPLGLQIGTTIRIPIINSDTLVVVVDSANLETNDIIVRHLDTLKVAVFLPFSMENNEKFLQTGKSADLYVLSKISLDFYHGFTMAMDSLVNLGYHVDIRYFDTKNDTAHCNYILQDTLLADFNLFVGPLFQSNFKCVAQKAKELHIPIVSPVKVSSRLLLNNRYVIKSHASSPSQVIYMSQYMGEGLVDSTISIISGGNKTDARYAQIFQKYLNNAVGDSLAINKVWQPSIKNYEPYIKKGENNYVAIISNDEAFVSATMSVFYRMQDENTSISVFGIDSWQKFTSIDLDYLLALNVTYPVQQYVEYKRSDVVNFVSKYRESYYSDPSNHVLSGFDIGLYFGKALLLSHGDWENYIENHQESGLSLRFDFVKISDQSGFENQGGYILRYQDFELKLLD